MCYQPPEIVFKVQQLYIEKAWELLNTTVMRLWTALAKVIDNSPCLMRYI
jgi:hypothetical protein